MICAKTFSRASLLSSNTSLLVTLTSSPHLPPPDRRKILVAISLISSLTTRTSYLHLSRSSIGSSLFELKNTARLRILSSGWQVTKQPFLA
jgi:hypothetical protein